MKQRRHDIRQYGNRRLYDPTSARYITHADIFTLLRRGEELTVRNDRDEDLTHHVIVEILIRQESELPKGGKPLLTEDFLRDLIRHGGTLGISQFLDHCVESLEQTQLDRKRGAGRANVGPKSGR